MARNMHMLTGETSVNSPASFPPGCPRRPRCPRNQSATCWLHPLWCEHRPRQLLCSTSSMMVGWAISEWVNGTGSDTRVFTVSAVLLCSLVQPLDRLSSTDKLSYGRLWDWRCVSLVWKLCDFDRGGRISWFGLWWWSTGGRVGSLDVTLCHPSQPQSCVWYPENLIIQVLKRTALWLCQFWDRPCDVVGREYLAWIVVSR